MSGSEKESDAEIAGRGVVSLRRRHAVLVSAALCLAFLGVLLWETFRMAPSFLPGYPGDAFFPRLVIGFTAIWAIAIVANSVWQGVAGSSHHANDADDNFKFDWLHFVYIFALVIAYAALLKPLGFEIVTAALMFILFVPRLRMGWMAAIIMALAASLALTVLFWFVFIVLLRVHVPLAFLPRYLNF